MAKKVDYSKILRGGDNKPTKPELWEKAKAAAKAKFDVYPSAVANAWASRYYADKGGDWKKMAEGGEVTLTPDEMNLVRRRSREFGELYPITYPTGRQEDAGPDIAGLGKEALEAYSQSDRARAPEFFQEGSAIESRLEPTEAGGQTFVFPDSGISDLSDLGAADGGMVGSMANIATAIGKQQESPFPEITQVGMPMENTPSAKLKDVQKMAKGGYVVTRSNERKGKTHKVTGPDGSVKFFGDPNLKNRPNNPEAKAAWYARHAKSLKANPHFRAYARSTWAEGGMVADEIEYFQEGGISGEGQGVQTPVTRELLASAEPFPNRTSGDEDFLPLPEDLEEAPAAPVDVNKLSEEEKKKIIERQKADAAASGVPFSTTSPVTTAPATTTPASPVTVVVANQPVTPAPVAEPVAAAPTEPSSPELKGILEEVDTLRFASEKDYEKKIKDIQERAKKLSGADRAAYGNALSGVQTARAELERFTTRGVTPESKGRSPLGLLRKEVARAEQYGEQGYAKYQEIRKRALEQLGGLEELLEDTPKNARANAEITRNNTFRSEAADRIANEVIAGAPEKPITKTPKIGEEKPSAPPEAPKTGEETPATGAALPTGAPTEPVKETAAGAPALPTGAPVVATTPPVPAKTQIPAPTPAQITEKAAIEERSQPSGIGLLTKGEVADARKSGYFPLLVKTGIESAGLSQKEAENAAIETIAKTQKAKTLEALGAPTAAEAETQARATPEFVALQQAIAQEQAAIKETARLEAAKNAAVAQIKTAELDLNQKIMQDYETRKRALDAERTFIRQSILDKTVDPNRYITGASKVGLGIAALLSVVGKGMGARSAGVSDFIERQIERDIDLQLKDLDKRKSVLGDLVRAGNDLDDALKLTTAFYKNIFAAQVEMAALPFTNQIAQQEALKLSGKLQMDAAKLQDEVLKNAMERIYKPYKDRLSAANNTVIDLAEYARLIQQKRLSGDKAAAAAKKAADTAAAKAAKGAKTAEEQALFSGQSLNTGQYAKLPNQIKKEFAVREVDETGRPTGNFVAATDPTAKKGIQEVDTDAQKILDTLTELDAIAAKYNYTGIGTIAGVGITAERRADLARAEKLQKDLAAFMGGKSQYNVGVPSDNEYKRLVEAIPNATSYGTNAFGKAKFDQFRKDVIAAQRRMRSFGLVAPPTGGATKTFVEETATPIRE